MRSYQSCLAVPGLAGFFSQPLQALPQRSRPKRPGQPGQLAILRFIVGDCPCLGRLANPLCKRYQLSPCPAKPDQSNFRPLSGHPKPIICDFASVAGKDGRCST
jgi:hypothetical protein